MKFQTFKEYTEQKVLLEWIPSPQVNSNPLTSVLIKIYEADKKGKSFWDWNFENYEEIQKTFLLNNYETEALLDSGLIKQDGQILNIDKLKFNHLYNMVAQKNPLMQKLPMQKQSAFA